MPKIVGFLKDVLPPSEHALLVSFQQRVAKLLTDKRKDKDEGDEVLKTLETDVEKLKALTRS